MILLVVGLWFLKVLVVVMKLLLMKFRNCFMVCEEGKEKLVEV